MPVEGVEGSRSLFPSSFVGRCVRAGFLRQRGSSVAILVFLKVVQNRIFLVVSESLIV